MKSIADQLPPEIARQLHPDRRKNEAAYWAVRDQLLSQHQGQWIGFADGAVIASGKSPVAVFHAAEATGRNPFVTCVGREGDPDPGALNARLVTAGIRVTRLVTERRTLEDVVLAAATSSGDRFGAEP